MRPEIRFFSDEVHDQAWPSFLGQPTLRRIILLLLMVATIGMDYMSGPSIRFPAFYAPLFLLVAWYDGFVWGSAMAFSIILVRLIMELSIWPEVPWPESHSLMTAGAALLITLFVVWYVARAGRLTREVRLLWGLMPICVYCHRIRNADNQWERFESYIMNRSEAEFTHGMCPRCAEEKSR
jgi:hypothetical protein